MHQQLKGLKLDLAAIKHEIDGLAFYSSKSPERLITNVR